MTDYTFTVFTAVYEDEAAAKTAYETARAAYKDKDDRLETFDLAVLGRDEDGKVKILTMHEQPVEDLAVGGVVLGLAVGLVTVLLPPVGLAAGLLYGGVIGAALGGLAGHALSGMSRKDLKELGEHLDGAQAALVAVVLSGEDEQMEGILEGAVSVEKKEMEADPKKIAAYLQSQKEVGKK